MNTVAGCARCVEFARALANRENKTTVRALLEERAAAHEVEHRAGKVPSRVGD